MGNIVGESLPVYVGDQIEKRQEIYGSGIPGNDRGLKEISYLNSRTAWVKLASGVSIGEKRLKLLEGNPMITNIVTGNDLARNNVLFNGLASPKDLNEYNEKGEVTSFGMGLNPRAGIAKNFQEPFDAAYGIGGEAFGFSPMPGITDVSVKSLNRGSLKKATINIKAHNKNQLDIIDVLYMRLGYTVLLEWGYDKYIGNDGKFETMGPTLIEKEFFNSVNNSTDYTKWLPLIEDEREAKAGNYEAMFGIISNFSWTFESNGSYSIKIDIMSMGDVIESLKANVPLADKTIFTTEDYKKSTENQKAEGAREKFGGVTPAKFQKRVEDGGYIKDGEDIEDIENNRGWADVDEQRANEDGYYGFTSHAFDDKRIGQGDEWVIGKDMGYKRREGKSIFDLAKYEDRGISNKFWFFILDAPELWDLAFTINEFSYTDLTATIDIPKLNIEKGDTYEQALAKFGDIKKTEEEQNKKRIVRQVTLLKNSKLAYLFFGIREVGGGGSTLNKTTPRPKKI